MDFVLMSPDTTDLFTSSEVPRQTCGRVYNWPGFKPAWDGATLHNLIMRMVTRCVVHYGRPCLALDATGLVGSFGCVQAATVCATVLTVLVAVS